MNWPVGSLDELCQINVGRTPARANPEFWGSGEPWLSIADMNQGGVIRSTKEQITSVAAASGRQVQPGTVLLSFKLSIGKVAVAGIPLYTNEAIAALPIRDASRLDSDYLVHALRSLDLADGANLAAMGATLNKAKLKEVEIPVPPLDEQRRIAAILDQADALRAKRRQALAHLDTLTNSIFLDMFSAEVESSEATLTDIATVTSGITVGRRTSEDTSPVPYLAVSNVQAGYLRMGLVKQIRATANEVDRYALRDGDLVLTEGGDPDKLGRGTVWRDELGLCLHQNHVFRVRIKPNATVHPDYLAAYTASRPARTYFLRAAKQTTGIASINATQLRALPVRIAPLALQETYLQRRTAIATQRTAVQRALAADDELFTSLQSRAFFGQL